MSRYQIKDDSNTVWWIGYDAITGFFLDRDTDLDDPTYDPAPIRTYADLDAQITNKRIQIPHAVRDALRGEEPQSTSLAEAESIATIETARMWFMGPVTIVDSDGDYC